MFAMERRRLSHFWTVYERWDWLARAIHFLRTLRETQFRDPVLHSPALLILNQIQDIRPGEQVRRNRPQPLR